MQIQNGGSLNCVQTWCVPHHLSEEPLTKNIKIFNFSFLWINTINGYRQERGKTRQQVVGLMNSNKKYQSLASFSRWNLKRTFQNPSRQQSV